MDKRKILAVGSIVLCLVVILFWIPADSVLATPALQMTPGVDPMSAPTVEAPTPWPGSGVVNPSMSSGQMNCPMMGGSMTGSSTVNGMGMGIGMQGMGQMGGMSQMNGMSMSGMQNMNDMLSTSAQQGGLGSLNPWWLLGWVVLFGLVLGVLAALGTTVLWLARRSRKGQSSTEG